jgi:hypothetical protein
MALYLEYLRYFISWVLKKLVSNFPFHHIYCTLQGKFLRNNTRIHWLETYFFRGAGVWTQGFVLVRQCYITWDRPPALFTLVILEIMSCFCPGWSDCDPPILSFSLLLRWQVHATTSSFSPLRWGLLLCSNCPGTSILLISASQVARITGMSRGHLAHWMKTCSPVQKSWKVKLFGGDWVMINLHMAGIIISGITLL